MISREEDFFYLGKILRRSGKKGHLLVALDVDEPRFYQDLTSVFLDLEHEKVPFLLESVKIGRNKTAVFKFRDAITPEHADAFIGRKMYLPLSALPMLSGSRFYYHEIRGFIVIDSIYGQLGRVEGVLDLPHQALLRIMSGEQEILIPVSDEIIRNVDRERKTIFIEAPDGLIDIYM